VAEGTRDGIKVGGADVAQAARENNNRKLKPNRNIKSSSKYD
jgi:hypothetical protein